MKLNSRVMCISSLFIFTNIYNPYNSTATFRAADGTEQTLELTELFRIYAERINRTLVSTADYAVADTDSFITGTDFINTNISSDDIESITVDPHPTVEGHRLIKKALDAVYIPIE